MLRWSASGTSHPVELVDFACQSCFHFRPACAAADLGSGTTHEQAAVLITEHVRAHRGYQLAVGGYHPSISAWLSAAYWSPAGTFVLRSDRGSSTGKTPLAVLIEAMTKGTIQALDPAMLDPAQYAVREVFLSVVPPPMVTTLAALLASSHVSATRTTDHEKVTLATFLPASQVVFWSAPAVGPAAPAASIAPASVPEKPRKEPRALAIGERCAKCGQLVGERWLFTTHYLGCGCG